MRKLLTCLTVELTVLHLESRVPSELSIFTCYSCIARQVYVAIAEQISVKSPTCLKIALPWMFVSKIHYLVLGDGLISH